MSFDIRNQITWENMIYNVKIVYIGKEDVLPLEPEEVLAFVKKAI